MYINSKIIKSTDKNITLAVTSKSSDSFVQRHLILHRLRTLIEGKKFNNNCCFLDITYKENGKYKTDRIPSRCDVHSIASNVAEYIKGSYPIRVEVLTTHGPTINTDIFVVLLDDENE